MLVLVFILLLFLFCVLCAACRETRGVFYNALLYSQSYIYVTKTIFYVNFHLLLKNSSALLLLFSTFFVPLLVHEGNRQR